MESEIYTWHVLSGLGKIMIYRLYLSHFFGCRWRYWGFICAAISKIRLSENSIFLFKNFSGKFLYVFKISNDLKILIFRGSCSDLINLIFASSGKQRFSEIKWFAIAPWPELVYIFIIFLTQKLKNFGSANPVFWNWK